MTTKKETPATPRARRAAKNKIRIRPPAVPAENLVDANGLAAAFSVSVRTVSRWLKNGVPALNIATGTKRLFRFSIPAVRAWHEERAARKSLGIED